MAAAEAAAHGEMLRQAHDRDVRTIAASPWFDSRWYLAQYPDIEAAGVDPVEHFVSFGWREQRNPSAYFQTTWYLQNNTDVDQAQINPLLHFIEHGEAENRLPNPDGLSPVAPPPIDDVVAMGVPADHDAVPDNGAPPIDVIAEDSATAEEALVREREDIALLQASPLFDAGWYAVNYPDVAKQGLELERHYLHVGAFENLDPSPRFRSAWYLSTYPDVAAIHLNPLIHFLRYGQAEGRKGTPEDGITGNALSPDDAAAAAQIAADDERPSLDTMTPTANYVVVSLQGRILGMVAHDWVASPPRPLQAVLAMARLHDWDDRIAIDLRTSAKTMNRRETPPFGLWDFRTLAPFDAAKAYVADGWFAGDYDLRLRIEPIEGVEFAGVHRLRFHQSIDTGTTLCGESLLRGDGPAFIDVKMLNPFKPLLITVTDEAGVLVDASLIPFPSLLRGGAHHAEVVALGERAARMTDYLGLSDALFRETMNWDDAASPFSIARIDVDLQGALGSERIFDPLVRDWLAEVFKLGVSAVNADAVADRRARSNLTKTLLNRDHLAPAVMQGITDRRLAGHSALIVPPDALPTVSAIASRRLRPTGADPLLGSYLVADATTGRAALSVTMPSLSSLDQVQPDRVLSYPRLVAKSVARKPIADPARQAPWPLAIRFARTIINTAATLLPHAPDSGTPPLVTALSAEGRAALSVTVVISGSGGLDALTRLLPSLAAQDNAADLHIVFAAAPDKSAQNAKIERLIASLFPARYTLLNCRSVRPAAQINEAALAGPSTATHLLFVDTAMILHDPRTINTMLAIATRDDVASVGCPHVRQAATGDTLTVAAGAYFPTRLSLQGSPGTVFEEPKTPAIMIHATMPVAANNLRFTMVAAAAWKAIGGLADTIYPVTGGDIELGLRARTKGYVHLNTTAVTVTDTDHRPGGAFMDVVATGYMPVQAWQDLIASSTLVRELR